MPLIIEVKVVPQAGKQKCVLDKSGALKCYLKSPPEKGLANKELTQLLAKAVKIPHDAVRIMAGATGRTKLVRINTAMTLPQLLAALGIEQQMRIT